MTWLLLIYTVPSHPTRKRAAIWRELKKVGGIYLHDGVAVLPERDETLAMLQAIAALIADHGGEATLVEGARLDPVREATIRTQFNAQCAEEYAELMRAAAGLLAHIQREREHRELTGTERGTIAMDLDKLQRWLGQIRRRDHFGVAAFRQVEDLIDRCDAVMTTIRAEASALAGKAAS